MKYFSKVLPHICIWFESLLSNQCIFSYFYYLLNWFTFLRKKQEYGALSHMVLQRSTNHL